MKKARWTMCVALFVGGCLLASLSPLAIAQKSDKEEKGGEKVTKLESKSEKAHSASTVNFAKDLGLGFLSLTSLGSRIEQAREHGDPVCLALAARELSVAEKVGGKQASLKAEDLFKEAIELAKHRFDPAELKAVALLAGKMGTDLESVAQKAEKAQADAKKARESGEKTRGIQGRLHADSRVNTTIDVFVDGRYVGTMSPFGDIYPWIGQTPWETTYLSARSRDGRTWNRAVGNAYGNYQWILYP